MAAAGLVFTSCSSDEPLIDGVNGYQDGKVSFLVELPGNINSRAMADGQSAKDLTYVVYDDAGTFLFQETVTDAFTNREADVRIPLVNGKSYKVAFFAKNSDAPYTITDGTLNIDYTNALANSDIYDAFYNVEPVAVSATMSQQKVTLTRPFGQLNVGATDWVEANRAGYLVEKTGLSFTEEVYTTMSLLDGTVSNKQAVTFGLNTLPDVNADSTPVKLNIDGAGDKYYYVASAYVLMPTDQSIVNTVNFNYTGPAGEVSLPVNTVPMQRNFRTNILGKFFTSDVEYHIVIDQNFDKPDLEPALVVEANELKAAIENASSGAIIAVKAGEITSQLIGLDADKVKDKNITIIGASEYGTYVDFANVPKAGEGTLIYLSGLGDLVFKNIKFRTPNTIENYVGICRAESVVYDNCLFEGVTFGYIAKENFIGCTFNIDNNAYSFWTYGGKDITMERCVFNNNAKGKNILVYGDSGDLTVKLTLNNCTFNTGASSGDKCAVEIHTELGSKGTLLINNCTVNGTGWNSENSGLWRELNNYTGVKTFNFDVYVDGEQVQSRLAQNSEGAYVVTNPLAFKQLLTDFVNTSSTPVVLDIQSDLDMSGVEYKHSDLGYKGPHPQKHVTINGNGHTISNLEVSGLQATLLPWTSQGFTISKLNVKDSKFIGNGSNDDYSCAAVFGAFCDYTGVNISDCVVDNVEVGNANFNAGLLAYNSGVADHPASIKNCVVKNSKITSNTLTGEYEGQAGALVGQYYCGTITNCGVENVTFVLNSQTGQGSGILVGVGQAGTVLGAGNWVKGNKGFANSAQYIGLDQRSDKTTNIEVR